jgi:cell division protein FtsB
MSLFGALFGTRYRAGGSSGSRGGARRAVGLPGAIYGQRRRIATVAAAGLAIGVGYHVVFGKNGLTVYEQKRQETHLLERQLHELTHDNEEMRGHVERLQSDPDAIEREAREQLHYTRPGEVIVTLPPDTKHAVADDAGQP